MEDYLSMSKVESGFFERQQRSHRNSRNESMLGNTLESIGKRHEIQKAMPRGSIFACVLVGCLLLFPVHGSAPECCANNVSWIPSLRNCSDGGQLGMKCPSGFFRVDPQVDENDRFYVKEEESVSWLVLGNENIVSTFKVPPERYCLGKLSDEQDVGQIALICFDEDLQLFAPWRMIFFGSLSVVSSFFLILTLLIYISLPEMRELQDKALMSMMAAFAVAYFFNGNLQLDFMPHENTTCVFMAFTMYYAYLAAFFWLNVISLNIWKSVWYPNSKMQSELLFKIYCLIGWGFPLVFLAVSLVAHHVQGYHVRPGFGEHSCWFNGPRPTWMYFYGPILVLLSMNICYLSLTSIKLWYTFKSKSCCKLRVLRFRCLMCVKLAIMMGFTWIFEVISFVFGEVNYIYWILPDVLNVLQGVFIFILLVVSRRRVRKLLAKRRPCNIPFPKSWTAYSDEENCEPIAPEELELSQAC